MANTISYDAFTYFALLSFGLLFVAALWTRGNGRPPTGVVERGVGRLPARPDRIADRVLGRLTETGPGCGRTHVRESDIPSLQRYAQRFEEAIEKIRLRRQGLRGRGDG
jgi:hypothetical protein